MTRARPVLLRDSYTRFEESGRGVERLVERGEGVGWPPGRNDACWCGSGSKHQRYCATRAR